MVPAARLMPGSRKGHRKSRAGCICCKRRKVKCDEAKPTCTNCSNFGLTCFYPEAVRQGHGHGNVRDTTFPVTVLVTESRVAPSETLTPPRRRRGRPRKDWTLLHIASDASTTGTTRTCSDPPETTGLDPHSRLASKQVISPGTLPVVIEIENTPLNITQAELLHHFVTCAALSLTHTDQHDHPIVRFWTQDAPHLGFQNPVVLYLALSYSGYHLADRFDIAAGCGPRARYISCARRYNAAGIAELNRQIPSIRNSNCGSIYVSSILVQLVMLAAGPTTADDLLVCDVEDGGSTGKLASLATGPRLIARMFEPGILFSGPLRRLIFEDTENEPAKETPRYEYEFFPYVDWIDPLDKLKSLVVSYGPIHEQECNTLIRIYEATFGNHEGLVTVDAGMKLPLAWLYFMDSSFVPMLRAKNPGALLLLAYFAPLLLTQKRAWFLPYWASHLLGSVSRLLGSEYATWLEWPVSVSKILSDNLGMDSCQSAPKNQ